MLYLKMVLLEMVDHRESVNNSKGVLTNDHYHPRKDEVTVFLKVTDQLCGICQYQLLSLSSRSFLQFLQYFLLCTHGRDMYGWRYSPCIHDTPLQLSRHCHQSKVCA